MLALLYLNETIELLKRKRNELEKLRQNGEFIDVRTLDRFTNLIDDLEDIKINYF